MKDLVSVIVPVYNVKDYLEKCVQSIVYQTYKQLEIILVDDGSTDDSGVLCDRLAQKYTRIRVVHKKNGGLSSARNAGIEVATGDYWLFVDSDDYIHYNMVELLHDAMQLLHVPMVECGYQKVTSDFGWVQCDLEQDLVIRRDTTERFIRDALRWRDHYPMTWNKLYDARSYAPFRFREGKVNEDEFFLNDWIGSIKYVGYVSAPLYFYRNRQGSIMSQPYTMARLGSIEAYIERYGIIKKQFPALKNNILYTIGSQFLGKQQLICQQKHDTGYAIRDAMIELVRPYVGDLLNSDLPEDKKRLIELCYQDKQAFYKEIDP